MEFKPDRGGGGRKLAHFCVFENRGRNDLVGTEGLAWIDKRSEDLAALLALRCRERE